MSQDAHDHEIKIAERFRVLSTLGKGGVGAVYLAHDQVLDRQVAVKMLRVKEQTAVTFVRFQKEARAIAKLNHGAIMTALDFGVTEKGEPYLVLDYQEGETLESVLNKQNRLSPEEAATVAIRVCEGLEYAHASGIIHRDIKPSNIYLVDGRIRSDSIKLLDFGLARITLDDQSQTTSGSVMGSPLFMSPEQGRGQSVDERSDIYSVGCVLFKMLTGETPFVGETAVETLQLKTSEQPPKLSERVFDFKFPNLAEAIVARCLATDKLERYSNISALLADLHQLNEHLAVERSESRVESDDTEYSGESNSKSNKKTIGLACGAVIIVGAVAVFYGTMTFQPFDKTHQELRRNIERPVNERPKRKESGLDDMFDFPPNFDNSRIFREVGSELRFTGTPDQKDVERLPEIMRRTGKKTVAFDIVEGALTARELEPVVAGGVVSLRLSQAVLTPDAVLCVSKMTQLRELAFEGCKFQAPLFKNPIALRKLENLTLGSSFLHPDDILFIPRLENVQSIDLGKSHGVTPQFVHSLSRMKRLTRLGLGGSEITEDHIKAMHGLPYLDQVVLADLDSLPLAVVFRELRGVPLLKALTLTDLDFTSLDVDELVKLETIRELNFRTTRGLHTADWLKIARMPELEEMELYDVELDSDEDLLAFVYGKKLKRLKTTGLSQVDSNVYLQISKRGVEVHISE